MAHVFALSGTKKSDLDSDGCKMVKNSRNGCEMKLCFVGKSAKYKSGWTFKSAICPRKSR